MSRPTIVIAGAGGHAKVVADLINRLGTYEIVGATDSHPGGLAARASGLKLLGSDKILEALLKKGILHAAVGLGSVKDTGPRRRLAGKLTALGFTLPALVHPHAVVSPSANLGAGVQVMAGSVINPDARLGPYCVVNTGAVIEHDCILKTASFVAPHATLGGDVVLGEGAFVGMGAMVLQGLRVGARAVIGAGAVVLRDVPAGKTALGAPARWGKSSK